MGSCKIIDKTKVIVFQSDLRGFRAYEQCMGAGVKHFGTTTCMSKKFKNCCIDSS